jgi:nucleoside-diphosphate-sugar epimerase
VIHLAWLIQPGRDRNQTRRVNVLGSERVLRSVADAGVRNLIYASSVGAYGAGPKDRRVDETWPTTGTGTSFYARDKAAVERLLDRFEREQPAVRVVRMRPGLIFSREAASGIRRLFAGPLLPATLVRTRLIPVVPRVDRLVFQAVHSHDAARAYRLALLADDVTGSFNIAAEPALDSDRLAEMFGARQLTVSPRLLRAAAATSFRLRLQPSEPGWLDMALAVPLMDVSRARAELGWEPRRTATEALSELLEGLRDGAGFPTPPLEPGGAGPLRAREFLSGVGARLG